MRAGARVHSFAHSLIHSLIKHAPGACSVLSTGLATGDSELNKIRSLPSGGSQVTRVENRETRNYIATESKLSWMR